MNRVVHFEIPVDDMDAAKRFYGEVFGWALQPYGEGEDYLMAMTTEVGPDFRPTDVITISANRVSSASVNA